MEGLNSNGADRLVRATAADGQIRCMAAVTTRTVSEAARRHEVSNTVAAALGRTMTGALLLGAGQKDFDRLTVQLDCDGPVGGITAEVSAGGRVRGYVRNPQADAPLNGSGKFDVGAVVGRGMFYVTYETGYEIGLYREPYRGAVPITSGEIGEDFAYYLAKSEQIPSAVMLGVLVRARESGETFVEAAGGLMIQVMPGADEKVVAAIESSVGRTPHTTALIREGATPAEMLRTALGDVPFEILEEREVGFGCQCSYERVVSLVSAIEQGELEAMLREDKGAALTCHFCNETYRIDEPSLAEIVGRGRVAAAD
ncbi:MAG TPA: Hsp33 family molecular chaperone HslO [Pyrinomonadaceae bacterium]|jgi:molecular chaperone Hsp33|nr:Hsp33 family molecular chaperone HslO [Pyrinomonadaceae bacterium]